MNENRYAPEGIMSSRQENKDSIISLASLENCMKSGRIIEATALMCDQSLSLTVDLNGIRGVIPRKEAVFSPSGDAVKDIAVISRVGKPVCFKVISIEKGANGQPYCILSRREAQRECFLNYLSGLVPGDIIDSRVTHLEPFGAFVDIGCGMISLLSIDCISVSRISHPADRFTVGEYIRTVVKSRDDAGRIYVSHKELLGTWEENVSLFSIGETVSGAVRSIEEYGIFVELTPNLAGLAERREGIEVGQFSAVYIKNIIPERMKVKLVLIDSFGADVYKPEKRYFIDEKTTHIDLWQYSPLGSSKQIESVF